MTFRPQMLAVMALLLLTACVTPARLPLWRSTDAAPGTRTAMRVFFATDRVASSAPAGSPEYLAQPYGKQVYFDRANTLSFGAATGTIARRATSLGPCEPGWWPQEVVPGAVKPRFPLRSLSPLAGGDFYSALEREVDRLATAPAAPCHEAGALTRPARRVILYVHGFNDAFDEAAGNAAQLAYDLEIRAAPVFFSWPTQQSLVEYTRDRTYSERAGPLLKELIAGIVDKVKPDEFYLIAHSLGTRITLQALSELSVERSERFVPLTALVLYAPDLDTLIFQRIFMDSLPRFARRTSVYANTHDIALSVSRRVNGGYALGDFDGAPFTGPTFHTIDVGPVRQSRLNHSGFEDSPLITRQIQADLLGTPISERPCLCRLSAQGNGAINPTGKEPFYRIAVGALACPFDSKIYASRPDTPACPAQP
ncbi:alpha/beta hydrolase [Sphingomonas cavernae]|uniref:Alpha/beta hydrolase n=1 Tax=Sphingomonas cavernae TaxID=2320861 RepID=A0A418W6G1_9SPHN|nr:alpha/beta hydrolase [Sphingomonas cavernae]RJF85623.1 alpha/beta hydrolase [Sphingomonas cavernae]